MNKTEEQKTLQDELKVRRICRFCLSHKNLSTIYARDTRLKSTAPLPMQIMAIASVEVFINDGLPLYICSNCTQCFEYCYQFKQMCKKADMLLRQVPLTGVWPDVLMHPELPKLQALIDNNKPILLHNNQILQQNNSVRSHNNRQNHSSKRQSSTMMNKGPIKILNVDPSIKPEPATPVRTKVEFIDDEATTNFLNKIENDDELLMDDVQRLIASTTVEETEFVNMNTLPIVVVDSNNKMSKKPKVLNKSSVRILNKEADKDLEPRLSLPKVKHDEDGNVEIVAEILDVDVPYEDEPDPKDAAPIEVNVFPCPHCERSFPLQQLRDIHVENHNRERNFHCEICSKSFLSKYDLQKHQFTHNDNKPFKCSACDKTFTRSTLLHRHEKTHTDIPKYICVYCEKPFLSREDMEKHAERHNKNRPFQCKLCNKAFAFKQGLERHEVVHSRQQPHPCRYCDQSFSTTSKLARHLTAHAGERPYPCKFCPKSYLLSHHFTRHLRSHKNEATNASVSFMCTVCNKRFQSRDSLVKHSNIHAQESLACPICKETFADHDAVELHIKEHLHGDVHACEFCDLMFMTADKLELHTNDMHTEDMLVYREDDRKKQAAKNTCSKKSIADGSDGDLIDEDLLQSTVKEMLLDDLLTISPKKEQNLSPPRSIEIKTEPKEKKEQPKILNQIIISSRDNVPSVSVNKKRRMSTDNASLPIKIRRIDRSRGNTNTQTSNTISTTNKPDVSSLRRKLINPSDNQSNGDKNKNESNSQALLKMLPSGLSIRKAGNSKPSNNNSSSSDLVTNRNTDLHKVSPSSSTAKKVLNRCTSSSNKLTNANNNTVVRMVVGDKKVKVQKISVTKSEAATLVKEGRIQYKDGNVIVSNQAQKKKTKK